jgi:outer membrane cobalamin receptor
MFFRIPFLFGWLSLSSLQAIQTDSTSAVKQVREKADSTGISVADSLANEESAGRMNMPALVGTLDPDIDPISIRDRENLHWLDYRYLGGILTSYPGTYVRDQFGEGQYSQLTVNGQDWRSIAVTENGRLLNDPITGVYNLYLFPTEYADRIEVVSGPRAFLYGLNSTGSTVNLVTKNYNSNRPYTKLNYSEGAYGYAYTDGTFAQNISRRINVTVGFQHQATDGRLPNSDDDAWLSREKVRLSISNDINIILSHAFAAAQTGLDGGADISTTGKAGAFLVVPTVRNTDSYEKTARHDVDASFVGTLIGDSVNVTTLTLYYSSSFRQYRDEENRINPNGIFIQSDHTASWMGGLFSQNFDTKDQSLMLGANVELRQIEGSPNLGRQRTTTSSLWAKEEVHWIETLDVGVFGRFDRYRGISYAGAGADIALHLSNAWKISGGFSWSHRLPNFQELFWTDSTVTRVGSIAAETHRYAELGITWSPSRNEQVSGTFFHRSVSTPIIYSASDASSSPFPNMTISNGPTIVTNGIRAGLGIRFWILELEGTLLYLSQRMGDQTVKYYPELSGSGGLYLRQSLLNDKLGLKTGFRGRFALAHKGLEFNPEMIAYGAGNNPDVSANSSVDFFLIAHLGDAYIHFTWDNLTNVNYFGTPFYPGEDRAIQFGISWEFFN